MSLKKTVVHLLRNTGHSLVFKIHILKQTLSISTGINKNINQNRVLVKQPIKVLDLDTLIGC